MVGAMTATVPDRNVPRRGILWFGVIGAVLLTGLLAFAFQQGGWTAARIAGLAVLLLLALGLSLTLLDAVRYWWGMRVVTCIVFAATLWHLFDAALFAPSRQQADGFGLAFRGFLIFGLPALVYSLWGSIWGNVGLGQRKLISTADVAVFRLVYYGRWLFVALTLSALATAVLRGSAG
jgi:hypothetical protein